MARFGLSAPLLALILLATPLASTQAQLPWEQLGEPYAGYALSIIEGDGALFSLLNTLGVRVSYDDGLSWERYGEAPFGVFPIAYRDGTLLASGYGNEAVWHITGNGDTLTRKAEGLTGNSRRGKEAPNGDIFMLTTEGLFISTDFAESWRKFPHEFPDTWGNVSIDFHGDRMVLGFINRAWYSDDYGETLTEITDNYPNTTSGLAFAGNGDILVAPWGSIGIWRSQDNGESFRYFALTGEVPLMYGIIALEEDGGFYVSTLGGRTYHVSADGLTTRRYLLDALYGVTTMSLSSGATLVGDFATGMWRKGSEQEEFEQTGMPDAARTEKMYRGPNDELIVELVSGYASSVDDGDTWEYHSTNLEIWVNGQFEPIGDLLILRTGEVVGFGTQGSVVRWPKEGGNNPAIIEDVIGYTVARSIETPSGAWVVSGDSGTFRSVDEGVSWGRVHAPASSFATTRDGQLWAIINNELLASDDNGLSFSPVSVAGVDIANQIIEGPNDALYLHGSDLDDFVDMISFDNGRSWAEVETPCRGSEYMHITQMGGEYGLGAITDCGAHYWDPEEVEWAGKIVELPEYERDFTAMFHTGIYLFVGGTGVGGIYRVPEQVLSVSEPSPALRERLRRLHLR